MTVCAPSASSHDIEREPAAARDPVADWRSRAREFSREAVAPVALVLERMDPDAAVAPGSPLFALLAEAHREGFTRLADPRSSGGLGASRDAERLVLEEIACADAGIATLLAAAPLPFRFARVAGRERAEGVPAVPHLPAGRIGCFSHGPPGSAPHAVRLGRGWRLHGATPLVPGAAVATHAAIACTLKDGAQRMRALALVPMGRTGIARSPARAAHGLGSAACARIELDMVELSGDELIVAEPGGADPVSAGVALAHATAAVSAVGIARAAYEGTLRVLGERRGDAADGGSRRRLLRMQALAGAARALAAAAYGYSARRADSGGACAPRQAAAAEAFAAHAATAVAEAAMSVCWPYVTAAGDVEFLDGSAFRPEKLLRDARACAQAIPAPAETGRRRPTIHQRRSHGIRQDA